MSIKENNKTNEDDQQITDKKPFLAINTTRDIYMPKKRSQRLKMPVIKNSRDYDAQAVVNTNNIDANFKLFSINNPLIQSASIDSTEQKTLRDSNKLNNMNQLTKIYASQ